MQSTTISSRVDGKFANHEPMDGRADCTQTSELRRSRQRFFEKYKWKLVPHSFDEVDRFNAGS